MKPKTILIFLVIISFHFDTYSQYIGQTLSPRSWTQSIYFTDIDTGYAVGGWNHACVFKTVDSGSNWTYIYSDTTTSWYNDVFFTSPDTGFAIGHDGIISKTVDGGLNWTHQTSGTTNDLLSIDCPTSDTCYIAGVLGTILKTTNGGLNWQSVYTGSESFYGIDFINDQIGYIAGNKTLCTTNGGNTWTIISNKLNLDISFVTALKGYAIASEDTVRKTSSGGLFWTDIPTFSDEHFQAIQAIDQNIVFVACTTWVGITVLKTIDGGNIWYEQYQPSDFLGSNDLFFLDENNGWVCGHPGSDSNSVYKTSNGGGNGIPTASLEMSNNESVPIYPNPVSDIMYAYLDKCESVELTDINGRVIFFEERPKQNFILNLTSYRQGIYFLKMNFEDSIKIEKIFKL